MKKKGEEKEKRKSEKKEKKEEKRGKNIRTREYFTVARDLDQTTASKRSSNLIARGLKQ